jgi:hypothetical protein
MDSLTSTLVLIAPADFEILRIILASREPSHPGKVAFVAESREDKDSRTASRWPKIDKVERLIASFTQ